MYFVTKKKFNPLLQTLVGLTMIMLTSGASYYFVASLGYQVVALILLLEVSILAMLFDIVPVLLTASASALIWNYFFIPPLFTFHIGQPTDNLLFSMYFVVALINAVLTYKIRQNEQKVRDKEENEKSIRLYNTLLNSLSHELRTPISTIIGCIDAIKENRTHITQADFEILLEHIEEAGLRLNYQVENLLNMSRLEAGMVRVKPDWCDLNELMHRVLNHYGHQTTHRLVFNAIVELPFFRIDQGLMEQIMINIINNALMYTPPGSIIEFHINPTQLGFEFIVLDNGPGFPEAELNQVFQKFYRLKSAPKGGTGLGLSIVKGFTEAHDGRVTIENRTTGGSVITISIPCETSTFKQIEDE